MPEGTVLHLADIGNSFDRWLKRNANLATLRTGGLFMAILGAFAFMIIIVDAHPEQSILMNIGSHVETVIYALGAMLVAASFFITPRTE